MALARQCSLIKVSSSDPLSTYSQPTPRGSSTSDVISGAEPWSWHQTCHPWSPALRPPPPHLCSPPGPAFVLQLCLPQESCSGKLSPIALTLFLPAPFCLSPHGRHCPSFRSPAWVAVWGWAVLEGKLFCLTPLPSARAKALSTEPVCRIPSAARGERMRVPG